MAGEFCGVAGTPAASKGWGCVKVNDKNIDEKKDNVSYIYSNENIIIIIIILTTKHFNYNIVNCLH